MNAATVVDRINAQTAKNAAANDRIVERSARQLADVRAREARRSADAFIRELERMRRAERQGVGGGGGGGGGGLGLGALTGGRFGLGGGVAGGIGAATAGFALAAKTGVEYRETIDRLTKSFESLLGSQQASAAHLRELQSFAARTPFEFEDVAKASQRFQNMGLAAKDVIPTLTAVGNAVAAAGGGSEQINRVSLAISQMAAKGKVSAEEMNQLAEAGVGGWKLLEQQTGKTKAELFKMAEAGQLSADTFITAFRAAYGSGNQMQRQMETLSGATSTLKDAGKTLLAEAYSPLHGLLKAVAVEIAKLTTEGWKTERMFGALASASKNFIDNFAPARLAGVTDTLEKLLMYQAWLAGGAAGLQGAGYGSKPKAGWGTPSAGWGAIEPPEHLRYRPKISDEELNKLGRQDFARQKEAFTTDALRAQAEAQRKAEEAMRKAGREAEQQAGVVQSLRERLRDLTIENNLFNASEVEQEIALMRARVSAEDLSGEYRKQADALANLTAFQMRALGVKKELKEAEERERQEEGQREEARRRILGVTKAMGDEQLRVRDLLADSAVRDSLSAWEAKMLNLLAISKDLKDTFDSTSLLQPGAPVNIQGPNLKPLNLSNVGTDYWKTYKDSWRESLQYMREDGVDILGDMFMRLGEDWKSALGGMVLDFARALNRMAADAAASIVWRSILSAVGGSFGGTFSGGGNFGGAGAGGGFASGTASAPPGLHWVGEKGPELVRFSGGEQVFNNADSRRMAGGTVINKVTNIYYQPRTVPSSVTSRRSARESFEMLLSFAG